MAYVGIRGTAYCLNHASELGFHYGTTPWQERVAKPDSPFLTDLAAKVPGYDVVSRYAPNLAYIGALDMPAFAAVDPPAGTASARLTLTLPMKAEGETEGQPLMWDEVYTVEGEPDWLHVSFGWDGREYVRGT